MNKILLLICLLAASKPLFAQNARFTTEGVIEFERSNNMYAILQKQVKESDNNSFMTQLYDQFKKTQPQFKLAKSQLYFSKNKTFFKPEEDTAPPLPYIGNDPLIVQNNTIYIDFNTSQQTTQKKVFEETYLLKDSTRTINWKITSEIRDIAGYPCRRANAIIMDSIYVVAFYTDEIPVSGGPESFSGLPGMILGVALPHENISWFAKLVTDKSIEANVIVPPVKGKATTSKGFTAILSKALSGWGRYAKNANKAYNL